MQGYSKKAQKLCGDREANIYEIINNIGDIQVQIKDLANLENEKVIKKIIVKHIKLIHKGKKILNTSHEFLISLLFSLITDSFKESNELTSQVINEKDFQNFHLIGRIVSQLNNQITQYFQ